MSLRGTPNPTSSQHHKQRCIASIRAWTDWLHTCIGSRSDLVGLNRYRHQLLQSKAHTDCLHFAQALGFPGASKSTRQLALDHHTTSHAGLLYLEGPDHTPIHDHADSLAYSLLLSGVAAVDTYTLTQAPQQKPILTQCHTLALQAGDGAWSHPEDKHQFHRLRCQSGPALFLNLQTPPIAAENRRIALVHNQIDAQHAQCSLLSEAMLQRMGTLQTMRQRTAEWRHEP